MKKAFELLGQTFESSSCHTPQYLEWHRTFKRELTKFLTSIGCTEIEIGKPNHFDMSGFFRGPTSLWYFRIEDVRWSKDTALIRTAQHNKDWTGGHNQSLPLRSPGAFTEALKRTIGI